MKYTNYKQKHGNTPWWEYRDQIGMCQRTGTMWPRSQLVKQMEQTGNGVTWTGLWVAIPYIDQLDQTKRVPPVKKDPTPVNIPLPNPSWGNTVGLTPTPY